MGTSLHRNLTEVTVGEASVRYHHSGVQDNLQSAGLMTSFHHLHSPSSLHQCSCQATSQVWELQEVVEEALEEEEVAVAHQGGHRHHLDHHQ